MTTQGSFGYKIGRKMRLMHVQQNADLLWQILVREIYVLMKHYGSVEALKTAFENLSEAKNRPKLEAIEKCKIFTNIKDTMYWSNLLHYCQHSFINILESGYFLNNGSQSQSGLIFLLDFNTNSVRFYGIDFNRVEKEYSKATIDEIMEFEDMPTNSLEDILTTMREKYEEYNKNINSIDEEIEKLQNVIKKTNELGGDQNIISQVRIILSNKKDEKSLIEQNYRFFYNRLDALNLIEH